MHDFRGSERATKSGGRQYLYDLDGNMETEITNGVWSRGEAYAGGRRWATYFNGTIYFNYTDWLGTVRVNTQYGGGWTQTCQSLPFGDGQACTNGTGPSPDFFTGKPRDTESGDDDFGARYYNAAGGGNADLGRFLTPDWSAGAAAVPYADFANPQTLNLYAYAQNNPLTLTDPNGHCSWFGCLSQLWKEMGGYDDGTRHEIGNTGIVVPDIVYTITVAQKFAQDDANATSAAMINFTALSLELGHNAWLAIRPKPFSTSQIQQIESMPLMSASPFGPPEGELADAAEAIEPTAGQIRQAEKVLADRGPAAVERSIKSFEELISEHEQKIADAPGFTSSMERELRNFRQLLKAYETVLGR